jgi:hypothetical protein
VQAEVEAVRQHATVAATFEKHPALLRLRELEALRELAQSSNARIYVDFDQRGPRARNGLVESDDSYRRSD